MIISIKDWYKTVNFLILEYPKIELISEIENGKVETLTGHFSFTFNLSVRNTLPAARFQTAPVAPLTFLLISSFLLVQARVDMSSIKTVLVFPVHSPICNTLLGHVFFSEISG